MCTIQEYLDNGGKVNRVELTAHYLKHALVYLVLQYRSIYQANTEIPVL